MAAKMTVGDGCWEWLGAVNNMGYATFAGALVGRVMWAHKHGPIPDGLQACHKCDNPRCVRPDHLFLGTQQENVRDCVAKGRDNKRSGEQHPRLNRKLSDSDVAAILADATSSHVALAKEYGVDENTIGRVRRGLTYRYLNKFTDGATPFLPTQIVKEESGV